MTKMAGLFRPKKLDLSGFVNTRLIRDNNKRMAFEQTEPERYEPCPYPRCSSSINPSWENLLGMETQMLTLSFFVDKLSAT
jgi:hypothetical protein